MVFSPDGTRVAVGGYGAGVWDAASGQRLLELRIVIPQGGAGQARTAAVGKAVAFSPDGTRLVTGGFTKGSEKGGPGLGRGQRAAATQEVDRNELGAVDAVAFSPDGTRLAVGGSGAGVWDAASGQRLLELGRHRVRAVAFSATAPGWPSAAMTRASGFGSSLDCSTARTTEYSVA